MLHLDLTENRPPHSQKHKLLRGGVRSIDRCMQARARIKNSINNLIFILSSPSEGKIDGNIYYVPCERKPLQQLWFHLERAVSLRLYVYVL